MQKIKYKNLQEIKKLYFLLFDTKYKQYKKETNGTTVYSILFQKITFEQLIIEEINHSTINQMDKNIEELKGLKNTIFSSIFLQRAKDMKIIKSNISDIHKIPHDSIDDIINSFYKDLFDYEQGLISNFFRQYIKPVTCYYCNIDYVNTYIVFSYNDLFDFLNNAKNKELEAFFSESISKNIIDYRKKHPINVIIDDKSIQDLINTTNKKSKSLKAGIGNWNQISLYNNYIKKIGIEKVKKLKELLLLNSLSKLKDSMTLDHFLPQSKYPYYSNNLFNFIPSCYTCNSKLKKDKDLFKKYHINYINKLCPASEEFILDKKLKFSITFDKTIDDVKIRVKDTSPQNIGKEYLQILHIQERYNYHKYIAYDFIEKNKKYSKHKIKELSNIINIEEKEIEKDILGVNNESSNNRSFSKLLNDLYTKYR